MGSTVRRSSGCRLLHSATWWLKCVIRWNGRDWRAVALEVVDKAEGAKSFGPVPRFALRHLPIERFLRLRRA
jgi:hypothetical protein